VERPKWVAIITGALAIALGVGYLLLVQLLDYRGGEFLPAPLEPPAVLAGIPTWAEGALDLCFLSSASGFAGG